MINDENHNEVKKPLLRMYVDENGHHNLREDLTKNEKRFLCLTGIVMKLTEHINLTERLNKLKTCYFNSTEVILHRRELISGKAPFEVLQDDDVRNSFNIDLLNIFAEQRYGVISVIIDKLALVEKYTILKAYDPYALALEYLMQRYQYWIQEYIEKHGQVYGDIMAESRGGREDMVTKETYRLMYEGKGYNILENADIFYSSKEIKLKPKKDNIAGLQFVDLLSHPARRYILKENNLADNLKPTSFEENVVDILVESKFRRKNGIIEDYGIKFFPK